jgi:DNA-directed RNA polymerase subunit RPC12/RpoP
MAEQVTFKCLRCGHEWHGQLDADAERMCPRCRSNSVRSLRNEPAEGQASAPAS